MQSSKTSKKTPKIAEETIVPAPETSTSVEGKSNTRTSRSSKTKKEIVVEAGAAKTHRKLSTPVVSESARLSVEPIVAKKAKTAVATADTAGSAAIGDAVGVIAPVQPEIEKIGLDIAEVGTPHEIPHEEIARLAHSYWVARGYSHGSSVEDWLRAEEELRAKR